MIPLDLNRSPTSSLRNLSPPSDQTSATLKRAQSAGVSKRNVSICSVASNLWQKLQPRMPRKIVATTTVYRFSLIDSTILCAPKSTRTLPSFFSALVCAYGLIALRRSSPKEPRLHSSSPNRTIPCWSADFGVDPCKSVQQRSGGRCCELQNLWAVDPERIQPRHAPHYCYRPCS